jgi:hypothetical protein
MAGASILRSLSDADLEAVHHMIRRDDKTDAEIAAYAAGKLGAEVSAMVIFRYRRSESYGIWLRAYLDRDRELRVQLEAQKQRMESIAEMVRGASGDAFEAASNHLLARAMTLAATSDDEEFKNAMGAKGYIAGTLRLSMDMLRDQWRRQVQQLKADIQNLAAKKKSEGSTTDYAEVLDKVDKIMGLA